MYKSSLNFIIMSLRKTSKNLTVVACRHGKKRFYADTDIFFFIKLLYAEWSKMWDFEGKHSE